MRNQFLAAVTLTALALPAAAQTAVQTGPVPSAVPTPQPPIPLPAPARPMIQPVPAPARAMIQPLPQQPQPQAQVQSQAPVQVQPASAPAAAYTPPAALPVRDGLPDQLDASQRANYRAVFTAIRSQNWNEAQALLDAIPNGPLTAMARAELYTARNSPKVSVDPLRALLAQAPDLPQAAQLSNMARTRGATDLPYVPVAQQLIWYGSSSHRKRVRSIATDTAAIEVALAMQPYIKEDRGPEAEALVESRAAVLPADSLTEWRQKVAWIYYLMGDDANARRVAAVAQTGTGDWLAQADWVQGLAAWRQKDCNAAGTAFRAVSQHATDDELRAAGLYWTSRAEMACRRPEQIQGLLRTTAQYADTFYGMLARETLGIDDKPEPRERFSEADWKMLAQRPNVHVAAALVEIGELRLADEVLRHQAKLSTAAEYPALTRLAARLSLPQTQIWLSHNCPPGARPIEAARFPIPAWSPTGGFRVDKALLFAHALQESRFDPVVASPAGAVGLLQVRPIAATVIGRKRGVTYSAADLTNPSINLELGQSYIEQLRDQPFTGGLLPKVIASYNAGPNPVALWNGMIRDGGDPLLWIESIPYWETRGYVMTVLRNYWMYERQEGRASASRKALAEGLWPKFPGLPGATAVRINPPMPASAPILSASAAGAD